MSSKSASLIEPGARFGRLTVIGLAGLDKNRRRRIYSCKCDCGEYVHVLGKRLNSGMTKSCGCLWRESLQARVEANTTHGGASRQKGKKHPLYDIWCGIRKRCNNPNSQAYERYGGAGIRICERWNDFTAFVEDMGPRPSLKHSVDRIDPYGGYEPSNCRWATAKEQRANRRDVRSWKE